MMYPDYERSILSITASLAEYYGAKTGYKPLCEVTNALNEKKTKNVILLLLDGMGENLLNRRLPKDSFLRRHDACAISTVYPSTTTAATTSLWTGLSPQEHGWLGWSLYFKELGRQLDAFINTDSHTGDYYKPVFAADEIMPFPSLFERFTDNVEVHTLFPFKTSAAKGADCVHIYNGLSDCMRLIKSIALDAGNKFICVYINEPDHSMHETGVASEKTQAAFEMLNDRVEALAKSLGEDSLILVTADHGLVDATEPVIINEIPELCDCLIMPPSIEARAASFFVKPHMRETFKKEFEARFEGEFKLYSHEEAFQNHLFGMGTPHKKSDDFVGDFVACSLGKKYIRFTTPAAKNFNLIGQHAGLTEDEMLVPVILARGEA